MKFVRPFILWIAAGCFSITGTTVVVRAADRIEDESAGLSRIVLGAKIPENPYTVSNMQTAATLVAQEEGNDHGDIFLADNFVRRRTAVTNIAATHKYVKITPRSDADVEYLQGLDDNSNDEIVLHDHPLDYEVLTEGNYYVQVDYDSVSDLSPVYVVLPVNYNLRSGIVYTVLDYLYETADNDEDDAIELKALEESGLDLESAEPKLMENYHLRGRRRLQSHQERELLFGRKYRPQGCVKIWDTTLGSGGGWAPLRQAKISIGRLVWWRYVHTDNNGCFTAPKRYRGTVSIRAKWRSNAATIRTSWNEMLGIAVSDGLMKIKRSDNPKTKYIPRSDDRLWNKGTVHNAIIKYNDYAASEGISKRISGANVWVWKNGSGSASAPMLKKLPALSIMASIAGFTSAGFFSSMANFLFGMLITRLVPVHLRPDMIYSGLKNKDTKWVEYKVFHESGKKRCRHGYRS